MKITAVRYSTVFIFGKDNPTETCENYLYSATRIVDTYATEDTARRGAVFVLETSAEVPCDDSRFAEAAERAARTSRELRRYQLDRFESGLYPTQVFSSLQGATDAAITAITSFVC